MEAGVPVTPGTKEPVFEAEKAMELADNMGYPVIIKASSGGGGKGMRVAESHEDFLINFETAQRESVAAFGDNTMYHGKIYPAVRAILNSRFLQINMEMLSIWENVTVPSRETIRKSLKNHHPWRLMTS